MIKSAFLLLVLMAALAGAWAAFRHRRGYLAWLVLVVLLLALAAVAVADYAGWGA